MKYLITTAVFLLAVTSPLLAMGQTAGAMTATVANQTIQIGNDAIGMSWSIADGALRPVQLDDHLSGSQLAITGRETFTLILGGNKKIKSSDLKIVGEPVVEELAPNPKASRRAEQIHGRQVTVKLTDAQNNLQATWRVIGRDGTNYLRQELTLEARTSEIPIQEIVLIDWPMRFPYVAGTAQGAPIVCGDLFCGLEHPMSDSEIDSGAAKCSLDRTVPLGMGQSFTCSAVVGVTPAGQLRRGFANYIESERAHPYRTFLHYNSWYDIGYFTPFSADDAVGAIQMFGTELVKKRGVTLDSFLFDDGWDDHHTLWAFNKGFPNGFTPLKEAAAAVGAAPGVWMSPWGGYGQPHAERIEMGKEQGFEINKEGFALSGPKYYQRFHEVCLEMIRKYGINQFKFDGTGNATGQWPGSRFGSDFEAAIQLIADLRVEKPDLYVNLTTGTWPSPFWLRYADSIWRGGEDHSFAGVGSFRQRWITYRDADTYRGIVSLCPLYPLNSLMLHGIIYAKHAHDLNTDPGDDFADEVHAYFGTGTQLQEMYITPSLLSQKNWDTLAEAAKWSRSNAATLEDVHWVGGDPGKGEVYGHAAWSPQKGILVLRNPTEKPASINLDIRDALELPADAPTAYRAHSPWAADHDQAVMEIAAGKSRRFDLKPFEVLTLEMTPVSKCREGRIMHLQSIDWVIIAISLAICFVPALFFARRSGKSTSEFFASGRSVPWWLAGLSMVATTFSSDTPNWVTQQVRQYGVAGNWQWWAFVLTGVSTVFFFARLWRRSGVMTDLEFYELRYSGTAASVVRGFRAVYLGLFFNCFIMGMVTLAACKIANILFGMPPWQTILICGVLNVVFAAHSGLWGVLVIDMVQFFIKMTAVVAAAWFALKEVARRTGGGESAVAGLHNLVSRLATQQVNFKEGAQPVISTINGHGQPILNMMPNFSMWDLALMIFIVPIGIGWWANWYPGAEPGGGSYIAQRMLASKSEKDSLGGTLFFNLAHYVLRPWPWIITALCSIIVFPDLKSIQTAFPNADSKLIGHDSAFPAMLTFLPAGFVGLMVAGLIAANSSTILTHLNWGSSYLVHDLYRRFIKPDASEKHYVNLGRLCTFCLYCFAALLSLVLTSAQDAFEVLISIGAGTGLLYLLRWFWWRINAWCEVTAMVSSFAISVALFIMKKSGHPLPFAHSVIYSVGFTTVCWLLAAFVTAPTSRERLVAFYKKVHPAGPGWTVIRKEAGVTEAEAALHGDHMGMATAGWVSGCVVIWSALFAIGNFLYGRLGLAMVLTVCFVISGSVLLYVINHLWDTAGSAANDERKVEYAS